MDLDDEELYATRKAKGLLKKEKCLYCGGNKAAYCEECYQELIGENVKLQEKIKIYESTESKLINKDKVAIETVLNLLEKKDKIIDEMAKKLSKFDYSQYCEVTNCNYPPCNKEKCIKQYFERKVEEE